ncbi:Cytochrome P450 [Mycena sanguinolenta]|uniref:Cytochrome P450 n=1 Tax=Mycena sanguinolenta TaxID=230812 RepID=A0A8H6ZAP5_9AGAR|nr:Cytochrome P450 [Mycena sanguinolenta]
MAPQGNMLQFVLPPQIGDYEFAWLKLYGPVYRFKGCLGKNRLMVSDPTALQYIANSPDFELGPTLDSLVHGLDHQQLRAALNVGFTAAAVRQYQPTFEKVAQTISDKLDQSEALSIDVCSLLSVAAFDAISEVVLGCPTENLDADFVKINLDVMHLSSSQSASQILADAITGFLPRWLRRLAVNLPTKSSKLIRTQASLATREGRRAVREKIEAARQGLDPSDDVYSLPLNSEDSKESLSTEDIAGQTSIIMIAGGETTANTLAFGLVELAKNPELQDSLRAEIHATLSNGRRNIAYDNMPLLNAFIKEALRIFPTVPFPERVAVQDTTIPLSEEITLKTGQRTDRIPVRKGQLVMLGIASYQRLESRWGDDADKFRPSRWLDGTVHQGEAIGPYANLLSFSGGPRTCLGSRFAVMEMQVILCELLGKFSFSLPVDHVLRIRFAATLQPVDATGNKGTPLCVKRIL